MKKSALSLLLILTFATSSMAYTYEITTETNMPLDGIYKDVTSEKKIEFPNCVKALKVGASLFQQRQDVLEFGVNFESDDGDYPVQIYLERQGGGYEKVYDDITHYLWLFDKYEVLQSSEFDLTRQSDVVTGCLVLCIGQKVPDLPERDVYWSFKNGEGVIGKRSINSSGFWTVTLTRDSGNYNKIFADFLMYQTITYKDTEETSFSSYQFGPVEVSQINAEGFSFKDFSGQEYIFTTPNDSTMGLHFKGDDGTGESSIDYSATKTYTMPEEPTPSPQINGSSGGGCSVGAATSSVLLLLPLLLLGKIK